MWDGYLLIICRRSLMAHVDQESLLKEKRGHLLRVSKQRWLLRTFRKRKRFGATAVVKE